jgi:TonB family protein
MKTIIILIAFVAASVYPTVAQTNEAIDAKDYLEEVEVMPELIGGIKELAKFVKYPEAAAKEGIQGTVFVKTYVGTTGMIDDAVIEKSPNDLLSKAALDAVRQVRFKPGTTNGEAVKVLVMIPVKFALK